MKPVEQAGLVKFDFLGLTTLTVLDRAVKFLAAEGIELNLAKLPLDDAKTYEMIARADTGGVFTFETQGYRAALLQMRPDKFEDLVAIQALNRPGPMANIPDYCAAQAWREMDRAAPGAARHPGRDLWHHGLPGAGDADRPGDGGLQPGRGGFAAPRDGQEDPRRDGGAARDLSARALRQGLHAGQGRRGVRPDGEVRRLRLQQIARRGLCAGVLSNRLSDAPTIRWSSWRLV